MREYYRRNTALLLILLLAGFLIIAFWPYVNGIFGALILFVLFNPLYKRLNSWLKNKTISALLIIFLSILIIVIPLSIIIIASFGEVHMVVSEGQKLIQEFESLETIDSYIGNVNLERLIQTQISNTGSFIQGSLASAINRVTSFIINLIISYFLLFYMFLNSEKLPSIGYDCIPFNQKNSNQLIEEFGNVTRAVIISTGAIAVVQGVLLGVGLSIFSVPGAALWGLVGIILSFLPVVGIPIIWIPAGIYKILMGEPGAAIGIFVVGLILSNADNFIRPALQRKVGKMHPLISLLGVFIGLPFFGIMGLIIGPLLLSYFFLALKMFQEEYITK
ncbi:MAG: AI-2E family transporter [Candidatus Nanoarchaeia archaeon]